MNKAFVKKNPVAAANFLRAQVKALDYCFANKLACEKYLGGVATNAGDGAAYGVTQDEGVWNYESASVLKPHLLKPVGTFTASDWTAEYKLIQKYGQEAANISGGHATIKLPAINDMVNTKMIAGLYSHGKLVWPVGQSVGSRHQLTREAGPRAPVTSVTGAQPLRVRSR